MGARDQQTDVVLIDDSDDDIVLFQRLLHKAQIACDVVRIEAQNALASLSRSTSAGKGPLVCFLDVHMPPPDGFSVLQSIRSEPRLDRVPVIMLSSSDETEDVAAAARGGAQCYLVKYPAIEVLREIIADAVSFTLGRKCPSELFRSGQNLLNRSTVAGRTTSG